MALVNSLANNLFGTPQTFNFLPGGDVLKGATAPAGTEENADQNSGPVNAALIANEATFTAMAGTVTVAVQPDVARNLIIVIHNDSGGPLSLYEGVTSFTIVGEFRGKTQTEVITITSTGANKAVADTKYRFKAGVKPFEKITSITYVNGAAATIKCSVAPGALLGVYSDVLEGNSANILKLGLNGTPQAVTSAYSNANKTLTVGTLADGDNVVATYLGLTPDSEAKAKKLLGFGQDGRTAWR